MKKIFLIFLILFALMLSADDSYYYDGLDYMKNNDPEKAREMLNKYIEENPDGDYLQEAYMAIYQSYSFTDPDSKTAAALKLTDLYTMDEQTNNIRIEMANHYIAEKEYFEACKWLMEITMFSSEKSKNRKSAETNLQTIINKYLEPTQLEYLLYNYQTEKLAPMIIFRLYAMNEEEANYQKSEFFRQKLIKDYPESYYTKKFVLELQDNPGSSRKIAILLPTTGEFAPFGESVRRGCVIANEEEQIDIVVLNTESNAVRTVELVDSIYRDNSFIAIIGPITSLETMAAGAYLYSDKILPVLSPTATDGDIIRLSQSVFLVNSTLIEQAVFTADMIKQNDSIMNVGVIFPDDSYGKTMANAFKKRLIQNGTNLIFDIAYTPGTTDFTQHLEVLKEMRIDAIYLPVSSEDAILLSTQIAYNDIKCLLIGTDSWYDSDILRLARDYVQGSVIVKPKSVSTYSDQYVNFKLKYMKKYNVEPDRYAMLSYDTFKMIAMLMQNGYNNRNAIIKYLRKMNYYSGVSGRISFLEGRAEFDIYTVKGTEFVKRSNDEKP